MKKAIMIIALIGLTMTVSSQELRKTYLFAPIDELDSFDPGDEGNVLETHEGFVVWGDAFFASDQVEIHYRTKEKGKTRSFYFGVDSVTHKHNKSLNKTVSTFFLYSELKDPVYTGKLVTGTDRWEFYLYWEDMTALFAGEIFPYQGINSTY